jgi:hypothetical protein
LESERNLIRTKGEKVGEKENNETQAKKENTENTQGNKSTKKTGNTSTVRESFGLPGSMRGPSREH